MCCSYGLYAFDRSLVQADDDDDDELDLSQLKKPKKHKEVSFSADLIQDDKSLFLLKSLPCVFSNNTDLFRSRRCSRYS